MQDKKTPQEKYAWVEYECGCKEGVGVIRGSRCRAHNADISKASMTVSLAPSSDFKSIE